MTDQPVVIATPTVMDGLVLRWFRDEDAAAYGSEVLSASRNGVMIHGDQYLHDLPEQWVSDAKHATEAIRAGHEAEARALVTHQRGYGIRSIVPVSQP